MELTVCNFFFCTKLNSVGVKTRYHQNNKNKTKREKKKVSLSLYLFSDWSFVIKRRDVLTSHLGAPQLHLCHWSLEQACSVVLSKPLDTQGDQESVLVLPQISCVVLDGEGVCVPQFFHL